MRLVGTSLKSYIILSASHLTKRSGSSNWQRWQQPVKPRKPEKCICYVVTEIILMVSYSLWCILMAAGFWDLNHHEWNCWHTVNKAAKMKWFYMKTLAFALLNSKPISFESLVYSAELVWPAGVCYCFSQRGHQFHRWLLNTGLHSASVRISEAAEAFSLSSCFHVQ